MDPAAGSGALRITTRTSRHGPTRKQGTRERFDALLEGYRRDPETRTPGDASEQATHIVCVGQPVDPELMTVIEIVEAADRPPGTVVGELRRGYTWRGRVLRFAEVKAVRGPGRRPNP